MASRSMTNEREANRIARCFHRKETHRSERKRVEERKRNANLWIYLLICSRDCFNEILRIAVHSCERENTAAEDLINSHKFSLSLSSLSSPPPSGFAPLASGLHIILFMRFGESLNMYVLRMKCMKTHRTRAWPCICMCVCVCVPAWMYVISLDYTVRYFDTFDASARVT
jgi:hypothetical protein